MRAINRSGLSQRLPVAVGGCDLSFFEVAMIRTQVFEEKAMRRVERIEEVERLPGAGSSAMRVHSVRTLERGSKIPIYSHRRGRRHHEVGGYVQSVSLFGRMGSDQKRFSTGSQREARTTLA